MKSSIRKLAADKYDVVLFIFVFGPSQSTAREKSTDLLKIR